MHAIRFLSAAVAYSVVILEVYSGVINGPIWWVVPGGLVISLLFAISMTAAAPAGGEPRPQGVLAGALQWVVILAISFGMSYFAWYFGNVIIPDLMRAEPFLPR